MGQADCKSSLRTLSCAALAALWLTTCGGGGGSAPQVTTSQAAPAAIVTQPANQTVTVGQTATFTVVASGTAPLTYLWSANGTALTGATSASYTTPVTALSDNGSTFTVTVGNSAGSVTSAAATLTVNAAALAIVTQPANQSVSVGQAATFTVVASGPAPLGYQWSVNGTPISGAASASYTTPATAMADSGASFTVTVTSGAATVTSTAALLTVTAVSTAPLAAVLPVQQFISVTQQAGLTPTVSGGTAPYTYAWTLGGSPLPGAAASYTIPSLRLSDQGTYQVTVTDAAGATAKASTNLFVATTANMPAGLNPVGVATSGNDIYLTSPGQNLVLKLNKASSTPLLIPLAGAPTGITVDGSGNPWVALNASGQVAKIDAGTGATTTYNVGGQPYGITRGLNADLWFTLQGTNQVGRITTAGGAPTLYALAGGATPAGLCVAGDGTVWFTERDSGRIGQLAPGASATADWACPQNGAKPEQILATPAGQVFYTDQNSAAVVAFAVAAQVPGSGGLSQAFAYGTNPAGGPAGIATDAYGNVWLTQQGNGQVTQINPSTGSTYVYTLPSSQSQPTGITVAGDGSVFTALTGTNQIAQIPAAQPSILVTINAVEPRRTLEGETHPFTVTVTGAANAAVTWELLEGATAGSITQTGVYTATTTPGIYHIIARSVQDPSKFGRLEVVVYPLTAWPQGQMTIYAGNLDGGAGNVDGQGPAARFSGLLGVAVSSQGNVFVSDAYNSCIRMVTPQGLVTTVGGKSGQPGTCDGIGTSARFASPVGMAFKADGTLVIVDQGAQDVRTMSAASVVGTLAGQPNAVGTADGTGSAVRFRNPMGLAVDGQGNAYVVDTGNAVIRKVTPGGASSVFAGTVGQSGFKDGPGAQAQFNFSTIYGGVCAGLGIDPAGNLYVSDTGNQLIRMITPSGQVSTLAGTLGQAGFNDGPGATARFNQPMALAVDAQGNVYVGDWQNYLIRKVTPSGVVSSYAGTQGRGGGQDGLPGTGTLYQGWALAFDASGNLFVCDSTAVRKVTSDGTISTLAGAFTHSNVQDGPLATAGFARGDGLCMDAAGNLYVADNIAVRKITPGGTVSTLAGGSAMGHQDGPGATAQFHFILGLACDAASNIYVADALDQTIRKVTPDGTVSTLAGSPGLVGTADGNGSAARFNNPKGVAVDASGNVFVADSFNQTIRKIAPNGDVTTYAGAAGVIGWNDGPVASARFQVPWGLFLDPAGNLWVADTANAQVRKITPAGIVSSLPTVLFLSDHTDGPAGTGYLASPQGVGMDAHGNLIVACAGNVLARVTPDGFVMSLVGDLATGINRAGLLRDGSDLPLGSAYGALSTPNAVCVAPDGSIYITVRGPGVAKVTITP